MPATEVTPQQISRDGIDLSWDALDTVNGNCFVNTGREIIIVDNTAGGDDLTVGVDIQSTVDGQAVADKTPIIANLKLGAIGPFPTSIYNDGNGKVQITATLNSPFAVIRI